MGDRASERMVREDWHLAADLVDELQMADPETPQEETWNVAIKSAASRLRRESANYQWAPAAIAVIANAKTRKKKATR